MCHLTYIPAGIEIDETGLLNAGLINDDGHGWAIVQESAILMGKSMKVEEAIDEFAKARETNKGDALFHSRWATHGTTGIANVHPFLVGGSHKTIVAHNGILPSACHPGKSDWRSDTRILADEFLPTKYRRFDKPSAMSQLSRFIGKGNKLCILTADKRYRKNAYLVNEDSGHWDEITGIWHSNYDYLGRSTKYTSSGWDDGFSSYSSGLYWTKDSKGKWTQKPINSLASNASKKSEYCAFCGYGLIGKAGYCIECGTCDECAEFRKECECHTHYYGNFDWDQTRIGRKALETAKCAKTDEAQTEGS